MLANEMIQYFRNTSIATAVKATVARLYKIGIQLRLIPVNFGIFPSSKMISVLSRNNLTKTAVHRGWTEVELRSHRGHTAVRLRLDRGYTVV